MNKRALSCVAVLSLWAACGSDAGMTAVQQAVTYKQDAAPVLDRYCGGCHVAGGIGPMALDSYEGAHAAASAVRAAVQSGRMPPWLPSDKGVPIRNSRAMRPEDRDLLLRWVDGGALLGDDRPARTDIPAAEAAPPVPRPDMVVDPGFVYQPKAGRADDYRCFLYDPKLDADTFVTAAKVVPGNKAIVHHVLLFEIVKADVAAVQQKDGADGTPGYTCFGAPGSGQPQTLLGWAPGGVPMRTPEGLAIKMSAGSILAMQVHYNLQGYKGEGDRTRVELELTRQPMKVLINQPLAYPKGLKIAAGDPAAQQNLPIPVSVLQQRVLKISGDLLAYGVAPHMHLLGTSISLSAAGSAVLIDVPRWDFHWQQGYMFKDPVRLTGADLLQLSCTYDNSAAHQPVIDGQQQAPRDVTWGEGTSDEMCLTYLSLTAAP